MTASHVLNSQQSLAVDAAQPCTLPQGGARSLRPAAAMQLRVVSGLAWVTLGGGAPGWREAAGDLMLQPGQCLTVAPGQHAVIEPLGRQPLHYQWRRAGAAAPAAACAPRGAVPHGA